MSKLNVHQYPYLSDNYGVLLHSPDSGETACIDCGDANAAKAALKKTGWSLTEIWVTHHHGDHTDGVVALKKETGAAVMGPTPLSQNIAGLDTTIKDGESFSFAGNAVKAIHTPGHTKDMINYYLPDEGIVFTGDTLFTLGCGRLFECDAGTMHASLTKLAALPADTMVYSSHEYTLANAKFALSVDPDNKALQMRAQQFESLRADGKPTVPSTIKEELATNPFLRSSDPDLRAFLGMENASDEEVFAEVRRRKDNF